MGHSPLWVQGAITCACSDGHGTAFPSPSVTVADPSSSGTKSGKCFSSISLASLTFADPSGVPGSTITNTPPSASSSQSVRTAARHASGDGSSSRVWQHRARSNRPVDFLSGTSRLSPHVMRPSNSFFLHTMSATSRCDALGSTPWIQLMPLSPCGSDPHTCSAAAAAAPQPAPASRTLPGTKSGGRRLRVSFSTRSARA
mmetsp:Transcript_26349/g.52504  ORF Transcript_26349/g.52504 Transcript_26349/m.52504 type:complete len:200 (-) Transcript_26349:39-638(-)